MSLTRQASFCRGIEQAGEEKHADQTDELFHTLRV
jgi:hypothetical protein